MHRKAAHRGVRAGLADVQIGLVALMVPISGILGLMFR
jgi:hypothetical protein